MVSNKFLVNNDKYLDLGMVEKVNFVEIYVGFLEWFNWFFDVLDMNFFLLDVGWVIWLVEVINLSCLVVMDWLKYDWLLKGVMLRKLVSFINGYFLSIMSSILKIEVWLKYGLDVVDKIYIWSIVVGCGWFL